ncbi:MAG: ribbon-helix-helix domain-containing protein [Caldisericia bacterium]|jgi:RHH-type rel operon transcriptional repressor/antitoxin RelB|nr:CopG family transcriptional regulator [Coprothermobacter sp.]
MATEGIISLRIEGDLRRRIDEVAHRTGRSKAWVIRKAVESYLEDIEDIEMSEQRLADPKDNVISAEELTSLL